MDQNNIIESGGFYFIHNFDSGNLGHVERVPTELIAPSVVSQKSNQVDTPDYEFNLWTRPDCAGTEFENGNRTWFYFGIQASEPNILVRLNLINLNKQGKMYNQGMAPVTRTLPGKPQWERIRDRPVHSTDDNTFTLSFKYRTADNVKATTFFAFTYPFSFAELQIALNSIDLKMLPQAPPQSPDDIYYYRECLVYSLEGRRVDLLTITSHHGITPEREDRLKNLFPDNQERPYKFSNKKVIFISARVHPGETPSSFVFNGFLNLLLTRHDPIAVQLRKVYVFKMIPFLNPDGVARGHYRTDTRGVNLNRVYLNPSLVFHPTVYASRALIRYYHYGCEKDDSTEDSKSYISRSIQNISESAEIIDTKKKKGSAKSGDYKRERSAKGNKSSTSLKPEVKQETSKGLSTDATNLADQVCDLKLHESQSKTSETSKLSIFADSPSLLDDCTLQSCLGSNVHLSTSEELNFQGNNPLRPLRDALKNSISLLMESGSTVTGGEISLTSKDSRLSNLKMGWCRDCRHAVTKLEDDSSPVTTTGTFTPMVRNEYQTYYNTIHEYREHQRKQIDEVERKQAAQSEKDESIYFCTNCFKKYIVNGNEEIKLTASISSASAAVSAGDSGSVREERRAGQHGPSAGSTGDSATHAHDPMVTTRDEKTKTGASGRNARKKSATPAIPPRQPSKEPDSGLYLYIDLHGHASKKGIFMYGNHFDDLESSVECMLLPRIMSLNNLHFHFSSCNFTERNMYLKDRRDGMSREGSGRVAVLKATGLVRSYTLECNYNTGRLVNVLPPTARDGPAAPPLAPSSPLPPKYTPHIFEEVRICQIPYRPRHLEGFADMDPYEVGRSLGASILDLTGQHPNSRIPCSEHRTLTAVRDWLRAHSKTMRPQITMSRLRQKPNSPSRAPLYNRSKPKVTDERKENTYAGAKAVSEPKRSSPVLGQRSGHDITNVKYRKPEPVKTPSRTKYLTETEPKVKSLASKRRSILGIRKPNSSKTQVGVVKQKLTRRSADDADSRSIAAKLSKRSFGRAVRGARPAARCRAMASSSSDDMAGAAWEDVAGGTALSAHSVDHDSLKRRVFAPPAPPHLKKIRLKNAL